MLWSKKEVGRNKLGGADSREGTKNSFALGSTAVCC